ncbi:MAG: hypothetical protein IOD12_17660 [Silvanigrellales bacterium]|nr:hypothetical protein [Silvanigrellales bacterium]
MIKIDAARLAQKFLGDAPLAPRGKALCIATDDPLFVRLAIERLHADSKKDARTEISPPKHFVGKAPAAAFLEHASQGGMFAEPEPAVVQWSEKVSAKQWEAEAAILARLPSPFPLACVFFLPLSARAVVKPGVLPWLDAHLCWQASEQEAARVGELLLSRHSGFASTPQSKRLVWVAQALEHSGGDLSLVDSHFQRMADTGLSFEESFAGGAEVSGFDVATALARKDVELVHVRVRQCEECGENPGAVLMAVAYVLRQVAQVHAALDAQPGSRKDVRAALETCFVPYPSQARVQQALSAFSPDTLARFFFSASHLELSLRTHRDPFGLLAVELTQLLA